jgi:soluble lytic murein transglycosylase-like protein
MPLYKILMGRDGTYVTCEYLTGCFLPLGYRVWLLRECNEGNGRRGGTATRILFSVLACIAWLGGQALQWLCISAGVLFLLLWLGLLPAKAGAAIPAAAQKYRVALISAARAEFGFDAPVALLAAQVHQESRWRADAVSPVGAQGLAQFMPATAQWLPKVAPHTGEPAPYNPGWALRALCAYDRHLLAAIRDAAGPGEAWAFTLAAYNGGLTWVRRDREAAAGQGLDPARYWNSVELVNSGRKASAFRENRGYARNIFAVQAAYAAAGWGQGVEDD